MKIQYSIHDDPAYRAAVAPPHDTRYKLNFALILLAALKLLNDKNAPDWELERDPAKRAVKRYIGRFVQAQFESVRDGVVMTHKKVHHFQNHLEKFCLGPRLDTRSLVNLKYRTESCFGPKYKAHIKEFDDLLAKPSTCLNNAKLAAEVVTLLPTKTVTMAVRTPIKGTSKTRTVNKSIEVLAYDPGSTVRGGHNPILPRPMLVYAGNSYRHEKRPCRMAARLRRSTWSPSSRRASSSRRSSAARSTQGSVALSLCTSAHPLHTRFTKIIGASISEPTMRPNPRSTSGSMRGSRGRSCCTGTRSSGRAAAGAAPTPAARRAMTGRRRRSTSAPRAVAPSTMRLQRAGPRFGSLNRTPIFSWEGGPGNSKRIVIVVRASRSQWEELFDQFDDDGGGQLDKDEFEVSARERHTQTERETHTDRQKDRHRYLQARDSD
jgi:hypothetical protein